MPCVRLFSGRWQIEKAAICAADNGFSDLFEVCFLRRVEHLPRTLRLVFGMFLLYSFCAKSLLRHCK